MEATTQTVTTTEKTVATSSTPAAELVINNEVPSITGNLKSDKLMQLVAADVASHELVLPGLDQLVGRRCRALNRAHSALIAAFAPSLSDGDRERAECLADAYLEHHDRLAGVRWYSLPSTQRAERLATLQFFDRAVSRAHQTRMNDRLADAIDNVTETLEKIRPSIEMMAKNKVSELYSDAAKNKPQA